MLKKGIDTPLDLGGALGRDLCLKYNNLFNQQIQNDIVQASLWGEAVAKSLEFMKLSKITITKPKNKIFCNSLFPSFPGRSWDRFFEGAERIGNGERLPLWLDLVVTGRCHCDCWHCFRANYKDRSDLPLATIDRVIQDAHRMGTTILGITGGEPMLRKDILQILQLIPEGMEGRLYSTGFRMDETFVEQAMRTNLTGCNISIDHYLPEIINSRRNHKNAYREAVNSVRLLADSHIYTTVTLCVTEDLCQETSIRRYVDFIAGLGADEIRVTLPVPQGKLSGRDHKRLYLDARRLFQRIKEESDKDESSPNIFMFSQIESHAFLGCGAGFHYVTVNNDGLVTPCVAIPLTFGNVNWESFRDIYTSMGAFFKSSGSTCFGKRLNSVVVKENLSSDIFPFPVELSRALAPRCRVEGRNGAFFENLKAECCV